MSEPVGEVQRDSEMDGLLRRSMAVPVPTLRADFERGVMRELREGPKVMEKYRRIVLGSYGVISAVTCAVIMRGQGLEWGAVSGAILVPMVMVGIGVLGRHLVRTQRG